MRYIYLVTFLSAILFSCKSESTNQESNSKDSTETQVAMNSNKPVLAATDINYPSLTNDIIKNLAENCDYIDYIFYASSSSGLVVFAVLFLFIDED